MFVTATNVVAEAWQRHRTPRYAFAVVTLAVAATVMELLPYHNVPAFITFLPATMLVAVIAGVGPGILMTVLATFYTALFASGSHAWFAVPSSSDVAALMMYLAAGTAISLLSGSALRAKVQNRKSVDRALRDSHDRLDTLVEAAEDYAIYQLDSEGRVVSWNSGAERLEGWLEREVTGRHYSMFFTQQCADAGDPRHQLEIAAATGSFSGMSERVRKDGSRFWADVSVTALHDENGTKCGYTEVVRDISERVEATRHRADDQLRLTSIVDSAMDAIITVDIDERIVLFNKAAETMFRCPANETLGEKLSRFIPQRFRQSHSGHIRDFGATGTTSRTMGLLDVLSALRSNGEEFPIEASISKVQVDGNTLFTVIIRDITQRKRWEERQSLLLLELAHRVKNTLVIVQSIVAQTRRFASPEEFHDTLTGRLVALGAAHDLLTRTEWAGATLTDVVRFGFAPYDDDPANRWTMKGPAIWLASNEAVTLSLAFHELTANAAKYGALSADGGGVSVRWHLDPEIEPTTLVIDWIERGGPAVDPPSRQGFGSRLLRQAITHELGGTTNIVFSPLGLECQFRFPLTQKVSVQ